MNQLRYDDLLKTAGWRVFSYRCKERAGFQCAFCPVTGEAKLQTHHWWYVQGTFPWEAEEKQTCVLCAQCHEVLHREWETFKRYVLTQAGETTGAREGLRWFLRYVFPGLSPEGFTKLNARLVLGVDEVGPLGAAAVKVLAGVLETSNGSDETQGSERLINAG